ncbi:MAG: DUF427 domain-containing protein [Pseudomonadales bacterium]|nr:DUF427 domain-containing protein [Pseudomonadales bacterium]
MTEKQAAWDQYPGYRIDLLPTESIGRVSYNGVVLVESAECLLVMESEHDARLYFPEGDINWALFNANQHTTFCPFKGDANYWDLASEQGVIENALWAYQEPFQQVDGLKGYVSFDTETLCVELVQSWAEQGHAVATRMPIWGDASDLVSLLDVQQKADKHFVGTPYPNPPIGTLIEELKEKRRRSVVEGGHQLSQAIVAASKTIPNQRVTSASMIFSKVASFEQPLDVKVDVLRQGRNFSTLQVQTEQNDEMRSTGILLMDSSPQDTIRDSVAMPDVAGPEDSVPLDMKVSGREIRVVDGAYTNDIDHMGPPELYAWIRFKNAPKEAYLNTALMTQATTHWTIAAALRPHPGMSQALAHVSISTGPLKADISFHDDVDVSQWMLYVNDAVYSGRGQAQGSGKIFSIDGRLLATYSIHTMIRGFDSSRAAGRNAM